MTPSNEHKLTLETPETTSVTWEIKWEGGLQWIPFTEQLVVPDGILSEVEGPIGTLRLIQQQVTDPGTGDPNEWGDAVNNNVKDDTSDFASGIPELEKDSFKLSRSGSQEFTVGNKVKVYGVQTLDGKNIPFDRNGTTFTLRNNTTGLIFIRTGEGTGKAIFMY